MAIPLDHMMEDLHEAYASAVVARAGATFTLKRREYGTDAFIQGVRVLPNGTYMPMGQPIACQLKATTTSVLEPDDVVYDMKVEAYNKLARWDGATPIILILFRLPEDPGEWLALDEDQLLLKKCCYWAHINDPPSDNMSSVRIRIPRTQAFTPDAVMELLRKVKSGEKI